MADFVSTLSSNGVQTNGSWNDAVHLKQALTNSVQEDGFLVCVPYYHYYLS